MTHEKNCPGCGKKFETVYRRKVYCCAACYKTANYRLTHAEEYLAIKKEKKEEEKRRLREKKQEELRSRPVPLIEMARRAKAAGLSYGQYTASVRTRERK